MRVLIEVDGEALSWEEIGHRSGRSPTASTFEKYMAQLRSAEFVVYAGTKMAKAADWLFLE